MNEFEDLIGESKTLYVAAEEMRIRVDGVPYSSQNIGIKTEYPTLKIAHRKPLKIEVKEAKGQRKEGNTIYADKMSAVISSEAESLDTKLEEIGRTGRSIDVLKNEEEVIEREMAEERRRRDPEFVEFCGMQIPQATVVEIEFEKGVLSPKKFNYQTAVLRVKN